MRLFIILATVLLSGCSQECYQNYYANVTAYQAEPDAVTPGGILVDTNGFDVDLDEVDRLTDSLELCLEGQISRDCLTVLIPPDWYVSECSGQQLFECNINPQVCYDKGLTPEDLERCPCACRATIQDDNIIVTTPNLALYQAELARMVTGINNIWEVDSIVSCLDL